MERKRCQCAALEVVFKSTVAAAARFAIAWLAAPACHAIGRYFNHVMLARAGIDCFIVRLRCAGRVEQRVARNQSVRERTDERLASTVNYVIAKGNYHAVNQLECEARASISAH